MSNEGRICPQCGYGRQPKDLAPDYECPRCGIIYAKYVAPKPPVSPGEEHPPSPTAGKGKSPRETPGGAEELKPASPLRRALAGIYTGSLVFLCAVPVKLFVYFAFRITHSPRSTQTLADIGNARSWDNAFTVIATLLFLYAFCYRPFVNGSTWGQDKFGVTVRSAYNRREEPALQARLLRIAGGQIAFATWPITLAGLFWCLYAKKNLMGIADRISSTLQYETGEPVIQFRSAVNRAFMPACIAIILQFAVVGPLSGLIMKGYSDEARRRVNQAVSSEPAGRRDAAAGNTTLTILSVMEQQHFMEQGSYTTDLEALFARYGGGNPRLLAHIRSGAVRAHKTIQGVELVMEMTPGNPIRKELRQ